MGILCFVFLLFLLSSNVALVASASWSEVTRFTGSGDYTSDYFNCSHVIWRINWNYTPSSNDPTLAGFGVIVYRQDGNVSIASIMQLGNTTTEGTKDIVSLPGTFYLRIDIVVDVEHYTVVVEQDMESVPEFSSMVLLLLFVTGILVAMTLARRQVRLHRFQVRSFLLR